MAASTDIRGLEALLGAFRSGPATTVQPFDAVSTCSSACAVAVTSTLRSTDGDESAVHINRTIVDGHDARAVEVLPAKSTRAAHRSNVDLVATIEDFRSIPASFLHGGLGQVTDHISSRWTRGFNCSVVALGQQGTGKSVCLLSGSEPGSPCVFKGLLVAAFAHLAAVRRAHVLNSVPYDRSECPARLLLAVHAVTLDDRDVCLLSGADHQHGNRRAPRQPIRVSVTTVDEALHIVDCALATAGNVIPDGPGAGRALCPGRAHVFVHLELQQPCGPGTALGSSSGLTDARAGRGTCTSSVVLVDLVGSPTISGPTTYTGRLPHVGTPEQTGQLSRQLLSVSRLIESLASVQAASTSMGGHGASAAQVRAQTAVARGSRSQPASFRHDRHDNATAGPGLVVTAKGTQVNVRVVQAPSSSHAGVRPSPVHLRDTVLSNQLGAVLSTSRLLWCLAFISDSPADCADSCATLKMLDMARGLVCRAVRADMLPQSPQPKDVLTFDHWTTTVQSPTQVMGRQQQQRPGAQASRHHAQTRVQVTHDASSLRAGAAVHSIPGQAGQVLNTSGAHSSQYLQTLVEPVQVTGSRSLDALRDDIQGRVGTLLGRSVATPGPGASQRPPSFVSPPATVARASGSATVTGPGTQPGPTPAYVGSSSTAGLSGAQQAGFVSPALSVPMTLSPATPAVLPAPSASLAASRVASTPLPPALPGHRGDAAQQLYTPFSADLGVSHASLSLPAAVAPGDSAASFGTGTQYVAMAGETIRLPPGVVVTSVRSVPGTGRSASTVSRGSEPVSSSAVDTTVSSGAPMAVPRAGSVSSGTEARRHPADTSVPQQRTGQGSAIASHQAMEQQLNQTNATVSSGVGSSTGPRAFARPPVRPVVAAPPRPSILEKAGQGRHGALDAASAIMESSSSSSSGSSGSESSSPDRTGDEGRGRARGRSRGSSRSPARPALGEIAVRRLSVDRTRARSKDSVNTATGLVSRSRAASRRASMVSGVRAGSQPPSQGPHVSEGTASLGTGAGSGGTGSTAVTTADMILAAINPSVGHSTIAAFARDADSTSEEEDEEQPVSRVTPSRRRRRHRSPRPRPVTPVVASPPTPSTPTEPSPVPSPTPLVVRARPEPEPPVQPPPQPAYVIIETQALPPALAPAPAPLPLPPAFPVPLGLEDDPVLLELARAVQDLAEARREGLHHEMTAGAARETAAVAHELLLEQTMNATIATVDSEVAAPAKPTAEEMPRPGRQGAWADMVLARTLPRIQQPHAPPAELVAPPLPPVTLPTPGTVLLLADGRMSPSRADRAERRQPAADMDSPAREVSPASPRHHALEDLPGPGGLSLPWSPTPDLTFSTRSSSSQARLAGSGLGQGADMMQATSRTAIMATVPLPPSQAPSPVSRKERGLHGTGRVTGTRTASAPPAPLTTVAIPQREAAAVASVVPIPAPSEVLAPYDLALSAKEAEAREARQTVVDLEDRVAGMVHRLAGLVQHLQGVVQAAEAAAVAVDAVEAEAGSGLRNSNAMGTPLRHTAGAQPVLGHPGAPSPGYVALLAAAEAAAHAAALPSASGPGSVVSLADEDTRPVPARDGPGRMNVLHETADRARQYAASLRMALGLPPNSSQGASAPAPAASIVQGDRELTVHGTADGVVGPPHLGGVDDEQTMSSPATPDLGRRASIPISQAVSRRSSLASSVIGSVDRQQAPTTRMGASWTPGRSDGVGMGGQHATSGQDTRSQSGTMVRSGIDQHQAAQAGELASLAREASQLLSGGLAALHGQVARHREEAEVLREEVERLRSNGRLQDVYKRRVDSLAHQLSEHNKMRLAAEARARRLEQELRRQEASVETAGAQVRTLLRAQVATMARLDQVEVPAIRSHTAVSGTRPSTTGARDVSRDMTYASMATARTGGSSNGASRRRL